MDKLIKYNRKHSNIMILLTMIFIGNFYSLKTYAYFLEKKDLNNKLNITIGEFNIDTKNNIDINLSNENKKVTQSFNIKNTGTLDQKLQLKFDNFTNKEILEYLKCEFKIKQGENLININNKEITSLKDLDNINLTQILDQNGNEFILKSGENIECSITIDILNLEEEILKNIQCKNILFDTVVKGSQIDDYGFVDISKSSHKIEIEKLIDIDKYY